MHQRLTKISIKQNRPSSWLLHTRTGRSKSPSKVGLELCLGAFWRTFVGQSDDGRQVRQCVKSAAGTLSSLRAARLLFTNCRFYLLFVTGQSLIRGRLQKRFLSKRSFFIFFYIYYISEEGQDSKSIRSSHLMLSFYRTRVRSLAMLVTDSLTD